MKIVSCNINNYKSICKGNILHVEDSITAVIGKNESGKSNVLEAIGLNSLIRPLTQQYMNCITRNSSDSVSYSVYLEFWPFECEEYSIENSRTILEYSDIKSIKLSGGFSTLLANDLELSSLLAKANEISKTPNLWGNDQNTKKSITDTFNKFNNIYDEIFVSHNALLQNIIKRATTTHEMYETLVSVITQIEESLDVYYSLLPQIFYRDKEPNFNYLYKLDQFNELLKDKNCLLKNFITAAGLDVSDFENAFNSPSDGAQRTFRRKINNAIEKNITSKFNTFYTLEKIEIEAEFENKILKLYVLTDDKAMTLNERSNGLKWYLNLFIDIQANHLRDNSVVYLFDEPGIYLHVNAQKELLNLFSDLTSKHNQIIYSTHSPYMIDGDNILNVRAIEKNENGLTEIYRNAYHQDLSVHSKEETLSPIVNALGCDLKFNLGPNKNNNLITEGISDYMYIKAMMYYLNISEDYSVIPSTGVSKIDKLVSILIGWGYNFKVLFDFDKAGYEEYKEILSFHDSLHDVMYFVNQATTPDIQAMKEKPQTIESLVSPIDFEKLTNSENGTYSSKTLSAKEFHDKVRNGQLSEYTD
jgi:predicted ATPase